MTHYNHEKYIWLKCLRLEDSLNKLLFVFKRENNISIRYVNCEVKKTMNSSFCIMVTQKDRMQSYHDIKHVFMLRNIGQNICKCEH